MVTEQLTKVNIMNDEMDKKKKVLENQETQIQELTAELRTNKNLIQDMEENYSRLKSTEADEIKMFREEQDRHQAEVKLLKKEY